MKNAILVILYLSRQEIHFICMIKLSLLFSTKSLEETKEEIESQYVNKIIIKFVICVRFTNAM